MYGNRVQTRNFALSSAFQQPPSSARFPGGCFSAPDSSTMRGKRSRDGVRGNYQWSALCRQPASRAESSGPDPSLFPFVSFRLPMSAARLL